MDSYLEHPLHKAVNNNNTVLVSTILDNNIDVNHSDPFGDTALHIAIAHHRLSIVSLLLAKNPNVNVIGNFGYTPLLLAVKAGYLNVVKELIARGADVRHKNNHGQTSLHLNSICKRDTKIAETLLLHGAYVDAQDCRGQTALHLAVQSNLSSCDYLIRYLLEWGASMFIEDMYGTKPIHLAYDTVIARHTFGKHMHKLECSGLIESRKIKGCSNIYHWCSCCMFYKKEFEKMSTFTLANVSISDLFNKRFDPAFMENGEIIKSLKLFIHSSSINRQFPFYASLIKVMFVKCQQRLSLLNTAQKINFYCVNAPIPKEITRIFLSYLDDEDLRNVIKAFQAHIDE